MATTINRWGTIATDPLRSFRFRAEFKPTAGGVFNEKITTGWVGGFTSISGLNITTQAIQYREGGFNTTVHQIPGMTTFSPVTFQRGVLLGNDQAIAWMRGLFAASSGDGLVTGAGKSFRVNIRVLVLDHPNASQSDSAPMPAKMGFEIHNAWISGLNYTDLNANDGALLYESMQVVHEGLSVFFTDAAGQPSNRSIVGA